MKDEKLYIINMLECTERIVSYTNDGKETFFNEPIIQDAVLRNFEILGEAAKRISKATRELTHEIPWRQVAGFRDILIHQYEGVDIEEVWKRIENDLPPLQKALKVLLKKMKDK